MHRQGTTAIVMAIGLATALGFSTGASAAKKLTYAEAYKICKAQVDKAHPMTGENHNERYLAGGACMAKYGYGF